MTAVPATRKALTSLLKALPAARGVLVLNGPWLQRPAEPDVIVIGWLPDEGGTVDFRRAPAGLGSEQEPFDVSGLVSAWRGDGDIEAAVDRADELVEMVRTVTHADQTLGGVVMRAWLRVASFSDYQTPDGAQCAVEFTVAVTAHRA